jgi:ribonuclease I
MFIYLYNYFFNNNDTNCQSETNPNSEDMLNNTINDETKDNKLNRFYYLSLIFEQGKSPPWSIHGLWPQYDENNYPVYCKKVSFNISNISHLLPQLEDCWYSNKGTDENFWKHEWEKHGSCVFTPMNESTYFSNAIMLFYEAVYKDLPSKYYNKDKNTCLIPVDINLKFINNNMNNDNDMNNDNK